MHRMNHGQADDLQPIFVYRCLDPDCDWKSLPLLARVAPENVAKARHPQHRVEWDAEATREIEKALEQQ